MLLLVPATAPEDIASYAQRVADSWKIGRRQVGDGVLVVVAKNDHAVRIEVAKALEGAIPDLAARQIIDRAIVPAFRADDYAGGLNAALDLITARIRGENLPAPVARGAAPAGSGGGFPSDQMLMFFFVGVLVLGGVLSAVLGRTLGSIITAGDYAGGLNAGLDQLMARIKGENLPLPKPRSASPASGMGLEQMGIFLFIGVALIGSLLTRLFGRGFGSLLTAGAAGGLAWVFTASLLLAVGAAIVAVLLVGVFGVGTVLRGLMMMSGRGGGGGGGGFSSGGGGDFGGGGASGRW